MSTLALTGLGLCNAASPLPQVVESLHESTSPESIAQAQRDEVSRAVRLHFRRVEPDIAKLSELLILPRWTVERRLVELGLIEPLADRDRLNDREIVTAAKKWLEANGESTTTAIARGVRVTVSKVRPLLTAANGFHLASEKRVGYSRMCTWVLIGTWTRSLHAKGGVS
jgi:hypothetical protein